MLTLQIKEKEIENLTPEEEFVRGTVGAKCQINFDEFWQSFNKYIVFKRVGYEPINFMVDTLENEIEIPYTILAKSGEFKIGVFGTTETETLPTLYSKDIKILYGTDTHGTTPPTYIPSEIDQLRLSKQDKLVSGENIKYINGESILGSGNIEIQVEVDQTYNPTSENAQSGKAVAEAVGNKQDKLTAGDNITIDENNVISVTYGGLSAYTLITTDIFTEDRTGAFGYPLGGDYREVFATIKVPKGNESNVIVYCGFVLTGGTGSGAGNLLQYISIPSSVSAKDVVLLFHIEVINDNLVLGTCSLSGDISKQQILIPANGSNTLKHIGFTSLSKTLISGTVVSIYGRN